MINTTQCSIGNCNFKREWYDMRENDLGLEGMMMKELTASFFKQLGHRIAELRKQSGLTQVQLADALQLSQQVIAAYELGTRKLPLSLLPELARIFGVPAEELMGGENGSGKRGPTPKLQRQVEQISRLPRAKQRFVIELLDAIIQQAS
jgi:transcriptional regulator with XRE-family HTH domain